LGPPVMRDFFDAFETERPLIRSPMPDDGPELYAAVRESMEDLLPWMPWPAEHGTVEDSEASAREARVRFLERTELRMHLWLKGPGRSSAAAACTASTGRCRSSRSATGTARA
jgi:hypothetical protein